MSAWTGSAGSTGSARGGGAASDRFKATDSANDRTPDSAARHRRLAWQRQRWTDAVTALALLLVVAGVWRWVPPNP